MTVIIESIYSVFKRAKDATFSYPAATVSAFLFSVVALVRIYLDWPQQESYDFLLTCLHWSFAFGAALGLLVSAYTMSTHQERRRILFFNVGVMAFVAVLFVFLYQWSGIQLAEDSYSRLASIATARMWAGIIICILGFMVYTSLQSREEGLGKAFFMMHKAFFVAAFYTLVIIGGLSGIAGAVEALLFPEMSSKVYMVISTLGGFVGFTIFEGYFPDFGVKGADERRTFAESQPKVVQILFEFILVPIMMALSVVLLLWIIRALTTQEWPEFSDLVGIVVSYTATGLWLQIMISEHYSKLVVFFRRVFPITALVILSFAFWAFLRQVDQWGIKDDEYGFIILWSIMTVSMFLLWRLKTASHLWIVRWVTIVTVIAVLPIVGYHQLPVSYQVQRLEKVLMAQGILVDGQLIPQAEDVERKTREIITDSVSYLVYKREVKLPEWLDPELGQHEVFVARFGFEQIWPSMSDDGKNNLDSYRYSSLTLDQGAIRIDQYQWMINLSSDLGQKNEAYLLDAGGNNYNFKWKEDPDTGIPILTVYRNEQMIIEDRLNTFISKINDAYPMERNLVPLSIEDMSYRLETNDLSILLVFDSVERTVTDKNNFRYMLRLKAIYLGEK